MLPTQTPEDHSREKKSTGYARSDQPEQVADASGWEAWEAEEEKPTPISSGLNIDQFPTGPLPAIDQWPTQPIPALVGEPFAFQQGSFVDNESIEGIDSLFQPALERIAETGPHPAVQQTGATGSYVVVARNLAKSSGVYALASLASPLVSLVLAPFLTHRLAPTDYGILTVLMTVIGLAAGITQLGLGSAFFRVYNYEFTDSDDRRAVLATVVVLMPLFSIPLAIVGSFLAPTLAGALLGRPALGVLITLTAWVVVVQNLTVPGFAWLRAENRPLFFSLLSIGNVVIVLCINLVLVGLLHWGVAGPLIATGSGYASVVLCTLPVILWRGRLRVRRDIAWSLITFGAPQVLSYISYWVLQLSDRYLLSLLVSLVQVASYAVAYSLGSVLSTLVISPFSLAWPAAMFSIARRKDAPQVFQMVFRWFSMLLLFVAFAVSIAGSLLLDRLFPASYHSAAPIIPVVAESIVFYGLYIIFMAGASIRRKTWMPAAFTGLAAFVNFALNLVLIPHFGSAGAAGSTLVAYIVLALVAYLANQRIYPIPYEMNRFLLALLIGAALYIGADVLSLGWTTFWRWSLTFVCLILYGVWILFAVGGIRLLRARGASLIARISSDRRVV